MVFWAIFITGYQHAWLVVNPRVGAVCFNFVHHKAVVIVVLILGIITDNIWLKMSGIILFGHSSFDMMLGYGLKYSDEFKHTHLGFIG